jgi:solute carrier family 39 (zinc transporter), member 1/2/3
MGCLYGITTPLGQAIGLILLYSPGTSYDPGSSTALVLVGVMNAISAGLLLWASLVELLAADFLGAGRTTGLMGQSLRYRIYASLAVLAGAAGMALVGAWA